MLKLGLRAIPSQQRGYGWEKKQQFTTEGKSHASNDTGLDDCILLASEGLAPYPKLGQQQGPWLDEEETQQTRSDVERRDDTHREIQLVGNEAKHAT